MITEHAICASDALLLAETAHQGQVDMAGKPYIEHPIAVANILIEQQAGTAPSSPVCSTT